MAVTAKWYGNGLGHLADADIDWVADTIKVSLHTSTYTPDQDADNFHDDATNEVTGTGYTAGGASLSTKTATYDTGSNELRLDADDVSWGSSTITARYAVIYKDRGGASSADELLGYVDFGENVSTTNGTFTITWASDGVLKITAS